MPSWMSWRMVLPSTMVTHLWSTPEMLRLYSSPLMMVKALDRRDIRRASVGLSGSSPSIRYLRYGRVHVSSTAMTCIRLTTVTSVSSFSGPSCPSGNAAPECSASSGDPFGNFLLMDGTQICSRNTPGGARAQVEPMLASLSASSLLYLMWTSLLLIQPLYLQLHTYKDPSQDLVPNNLTIRYFRFLELFLTYMRI